MPKNEVAIADRVKEIIVDTLIVDESEVTPGSSLYEDLGADSLDVMEMCLKIEEEWGFEVDDVMGEKLRTVADVVALVEKMKVQ